MGLCNVFIMYKYGLGDCQTTYRETSLCSRFVLWLHSIRISFSTDMVLLF